MTHQSFFRCLDKWISTVGSRVNSAFTNDAIFLRFKIYQMRPRRNLESDAVSEQWWAMVALPQSPDTPAPNLSPLLPRSVPPPAAPRRAVPRHAKLLWRRRQQRTLADTWSCHREQIGGGADTGSGTMGWVTPATSPLPSLHIVHIRREYSRVSQL